MYTIPSGVKTIGAGAALGCNKITQVIIPDGVEIIESQAFYYCSNLTSVDISKSVTDIKTYAFSACRKLTAINVATDNSAYKSVDGVLFDKAVDTLLAFPGGKGGEYTVPNGVTQINIAAFYSNFNITAVVLPSGLKIIDNSAFNNCTNLAYVTIPNSVTKIKLYAFKACTALENVYYGGSSEDWKKITISLGNDDLSNKLTYFALTPAESLVCDGSAKTASVAASRDDVGAITVKYYDENNNQLSGAPINPGKYTVKIDVAKGATRPAATDLEVGSFYITKAKDFKIVSLSAQKVKLIAPTAGKYTLIFTDFDGTAVKDVKSAPLTITEAQAGAVVDSSAPITLGAGDKVMLWNTLAEMKPLCTAQTMN